MCLEDAGLLIKGVSETGMLVASLLGNVLTGKEVTEAGDETIIPNQNVHCCLIV